MPSEVIDELSTVEPDTQAPRVAHFESLSAPVGQKIALCGARLEGIYAPRTAPHCQECEWKLTAIIRQGSPDG
jgi:predicted Rossmann fold nucleotide-binding protein DprA/Smf involved in DNA uptake